jgi:hypothetical protein
MLTTEPNPLLRPPPEAAQREVAGRTALLRKANRRKLMDAMQSRNAVREIAALPGPEESLHIICRGNFPLWSIVPATINLAAPATINVLSIATLGFSAANATALLGLIDAGKVNTVRVIASVYFERQNPAEYRLMSDGLAERGQKIVALRSHAKVITMALSDGGMLSVESSANLRSCRNLEQVTLTNSPDLCRFHAGWIERAIDAAGAAINARAAE